MFGGESNSFVTQYWYVQCVEQSLLIQSPRCLMKYVNKLLSALLNGNSCTTIWCVLLVLKSVHVWLVGIIWCLKFASLIKHIPIFTQVNRSDTFNYTRLIPWTYLKMRWKLWVFPAYYMHTQTRSWRLFQESSSHTAEIKDPWCRRNRCVLESSGRASGEPRLCGHTRLCIPCEYHGVLMT